MEPIDKAKYIAELLDNKKAKDIEILEIGPLSSIGDYFVIATGTSTTQVKSLADEVLEKMKENYETDARHIEGYNTSSWILLDYSDVVVHVFLEESRQFYNIERLWDEAVKIEL